MVFQCEVAATATRQSGLMYNGVHTIGFNMNDACIQGIEDRVAAYLNKSPNPERCAGIVTNTYVVDSGLEYCCHTGGGKFAVQVTPPANSAISTTPPSTLQASLGTAVMMDKENSSVDHWETRKVVGVTVLKLTHQANQVKLGPSFVEDTWQTYGAIPTVCDLSMPVLPAATPHAGCCPNIRQCCLSCC